MNIKKIKDLGIVIPAYNESKTIKSVSKKASFFADICVVNDNSKDKTQIILKKNNINHISNLKRLGYEASVIKGIKYFYKKKKYVLTFDADLQFRLSDIPKAYNKINYKIADIVIGSRILKNRISEIILSFLFKIKFGIKDPISGLKIYKINSIKKLLKHTKKDLFLVDIISNGFKENLRIFTFNIKTKKRIDEPRIGNLIQSNLKIIKIIFYIFFFNKYV